MDSLENDSTKAEALLQKALANAKDAEFEAGLAYPFLNNRYSEQRREAAHMAQEAAHSTLKQVFLAEEFFYKEDYPALEHVCQEIQENLEKARNAALYAMTDDKTLGYCPNCLTQTNRLRVKPERVDALDDGTQCWMKRFQCFQCQTPWREIYTFEGLLVQRIAEI